MCVQLIKTCPVTIAPYKKDQFSMQCNELHKYRKHANVSNALYHLYMWVILHILQRSWIIIVKKGKMIFFFSHFQSLSLQKYQNSLQKAILEKFEWTTCDRKLFWVAPGHSAVLAVVVENERERWVCASPYSYRCSQFFKFFVWASSLLKHAS